MRTYDYRCSCGVRFEATVGSIDESPRCPECGAQTARRLPAASAAVLGRAKLPPTGAAAPKSWEGTHGGDTEYIAHWRRALDERAKLEQRHPELAEHRQPVVAHEGPYSRAPLTAEESATLGPHRRPRPHAHPRPPEPEQRGRATHD